MRQTPISLPRLSRRTSRRAPQPGCPPGSTSSATPPSRRWWTPWIVSSPSSARPRSPGAGTGSNISRWSTPIRPARLGACGVIASMQPNFDALWGGRDGMYAQRLGADRAAGLNPLALLAAKGVPLAFGSDAPVTSIEPWGRVRRYITGPRAAPSRPVPRSRQRPGEPGGRRGCGTVSPAPWCPGRRPHTRCGRSPADPSVSRSRPPPTRCSAGPPSRVHGCLRCHGSTRPTHCRRCLRTVHRGRVLHE